MVGVHFFDWWLPYLQSSASNYSRFSFYAPHTQILPVIGHHYPQMEVTPSWIFSCSPRGLLAYQPRSIAGTSKQCSLSFGQVLQSHLIGKSPNGAIREIAVSENAVLREQLIKLPSSLPRSGLAITNPKFCEQIGDLHMVFRRG
jgi:hypothetical protein